MKVNHLEFDFAIPELHNFRFKRKTCSAEVLDNPIGWRERRGYGNNCQRFAVYLINGQPYCRLHAGALLLDELLKDHPTHHYIKALQPRIMEKDK